MAGRSDKLAAALSAETVAAIRQRIEAELLVEKSTKRSALRLALIGVIREGLLVADQRLPAETDLGAAVGLSLGTVQAALGQLQDMGVIVRRRCGGTRIAGVGPISPSVWHFRFRATTDGQAVRLLD